MLWWIKFAKVFTSSPCHSELMLSSLFVLVVALISNYLCNGWRKQTSFINLDVYAFEGTICVLRQCSLMNAYDLLRTCLNIELLALLGIFCLDFEVSVHFSHKIYFTPSYALHKLPQLFCSHLSLFHPAFNSIERLHSSNMYILCSIIIPKWISLKFSALLNQLRVISAFKFWLQFLRRQVGD